MQDELRWYVFDDRAMYRPGEEVHVKGWLRRVGGRQDGDVGLPGDALQTVSYQVIGPQGNELLSGQAQVNALGGFDFIFTLPDNANLGYARIALEAQGSLAGLDGRRYRPRLPDPRVPPARVRGNGAQRDHRPLLCRRTGHGGGRGQLLCRRPAAQRRGDLAGQLFAQQLLAAQLARLYLWHLDALVVCMRPVYLEEAYEPYWPDSEEVDVETFTGVTDASGNHYLRLDFEQPDDAPARSACWPRRR